MSSSPESKKKIVIEASALEPEHESESESKPKSNPNPEEREELEEETREQKQEEREERQEEREERQEEEAKEEVEEREGEKEKVKRKKGDKGDKGNDDGSDDTSQLFNETIPWNIIDKLFNDNPNLLVAHQIDSYNEFMLNGIRQIFKEHNPIVFQKEKDEKTDTFRNVSRFYLGGKNGDKIYYGKPVIYDETGTTSRVHYMYPNEARLRNMTYGVTIHYDVEVEFDNVTETIVEEGKQEEEEVQKVSAEMKNKYKSKEKENKTAIIGSDYEEELE
jgi:hypothetical protein